MDRKLKRRLNDIAKRYPDDMLACRDHGHSWEPLEAAWMDDGTIERVLKCSRCEGRRVQTLDKNGYVIKGHYNYMDGYAMKGVGRLDTDGRAILRRASVMKLLD